MIQAKDLRIGNYIAMYENGRDRVVAEIKRFEGGLYAGLQDHGHTISTYYYPEESLFGIAIAPELLERLGFEKATDRVYGGWLSPEVADERIRIRVDELGFFYTPNERSNHRYIDSVHQLQNLFYALTGTELTLKKPCVKAQ